MAADDVSLTDLEVIQRYSLAVRAATAPRADVIAALASDLAHLRASLRAGAATSGSEAATSREAGAATSDPDTAPAAEAAASRSPAKASRSRKV